MKSIIISSKGYILDCYPGQWVIKFQQSSPGYNNDTEYDGSQER